MSLSDDAVFPSEEAQELYPLEKYPCKFCSNLECGPPRLVDRPSEFYWHHWQFRMGCKRFGTSEFCGYPPREGTAQPTHYEHHYEYRDTDHPRKETS